MCFAVLSRLRARGDDLRPGHSVDVRVRLNEEHIARLERRLGLAHEQEVHREAIVERHSGLDLIDLLLTELELQRLNVALQVVDLPATDNGENMRRFVHDIRQGDTGDQRPLLVRNLLELLADGNLVLVGRAHLTTLLRLALLFALELAAAEGAPGGQRHAFGLGHGQDVALEVAIRGVPAALVDDELAQAVVAGVLVGLGDDPGWGVGDAEVEDLALVDEGVEGLHDFFDRGGEVPPVEVELEGGVSGWSGGSGMRGGSEDGTYHVHVVGLELLQAGVETEVERLCVVTLEVALELLLARICTPEASGELGRNHHLATISALLHPVTDPGLGLFILVVVGCVDKVTALVVEVVEDLKGGLLVALAHEPFPGVTEVHRSEA